MTKLAQRLSTIPNERFHATDVDGNQFSVVVEEYAEDLWDECERMEAEIERLRAALKEICDAGDTDWAAKKMYWAARNALNGAHTQAGAALTVSALPSESVK